MAQTSKYYKQQRYVSYDSGSTWTPLSEYRKGAWIEDNSVDCGGSPITYEKWEAVQGEYVCDNGNKYTKERKYTSTDNINWTPTDQYRKGALIESDSSDCGYMEKWEQMDINTYWVCDEYAPSGFKIQKTYLDGYVYSAECTSNNVLTDSDVRDMNDPLQSTKPYSAITDVVVGDCVETINAYVFDGCVSLSSVTLAPSVKYVGNCSDYAETQLPIEGGIRYMGDCAYEAVWRDGHFHNASYTVRSGTRIIAQRSFQEGAYAYIESVSLPSSLRYIGGYAFFKCWNLRHIDIPSNVEEIGIGAFSYSSLEEITIPSNVKIIDNNTFRHCVSLTSVTILGEVDEIRSYSFSECHTLSLFTIHSTTPPALHGYAFNNTNMNNVTILVPAQSVDAYKNASVWSNYANRIQPIT